LAGKQAVENKRQKWLIENRVGVTEIYNPLIDNNLN
jgi:hypothetical protein